VKNCPERERLWAVYDVALNVFSSTASVLSDAVHTNQFSAALTATQDANKACMEARAAWERHRTEHKCDRHEGPLAKPSHP
jgi:hypothetical protein